MVFEDESRVFSRYGKTGSLWEMFCALLHLLPVVGYSTRVRRNEDAMKCLSRKTNKR